MNKQRTIILAIALLFTSSMYGLSSFVELSFGAGWSTLGYGLSNENYPGLSVRQPGSYGFGAHVGYGLQFTKHVGLGIGVNLTRYGSNARISGEMVWQGVKDTDGELYDHHTVVTNWSDNQEIYMLEIPLSLYLRFSVLQDVHIYGQIGAKACIPLMNSGHYSGSLSHEGFYEPWMMTISDIPHHGFYSSSMDGGYGLQTKITVAAILKMGIEAPVDQLRNVWLYGAIYGTFHFMPAITPATDAAELGWRNDTQDETMQQAHYFMSDYSPILQTNLITGRMNPIAVGAEIGVRFRIPHDKRNHGPCRCLKE